MTIKSRHLLPSRAKASWTVLSVHGFHTYQHDLCLVIQWQLYAIVSFFSNDKNFILIGVITLAPTTASPSIKIYLNTPATHSFML